MQIHLFSTSISSREREVKYNNTTDSFQDNGRNSNRKAAFPSCSFQ